MSNGDLKFETYFKYTAYSMNLNGTYPSLVRNKLWFLKILFLFALNFFGTYLLIYSTFLHDIPNGNFAEVCKNVCIIIIALNVAFKYVVLLYHRESIEKLISIVDKDYQLSKQFPLEEQIVVKEYARKGYLVCLLWLICASAASAVFPLKALCLTAYSYWTGENKLVLMFDVTTLPPVLERHRSSIFMYMVLSAQCIMDSAFSSSIYIGFDPLIPIFSLHTCGQLDILGKRISTALSDAQTVHEKKICLKNIIIKLQDLYRLIEMVQTNFQLMNEFNMKTTTALVPITGFHTIEALRNNETSYEFLVFLGGAVVHFLMPCYFGDLLVEKSEAFRQKVYSCGWEKYPDISVRQTVLLMLTRATKPLGISTVFNILSLDTFSIMLRQAYALFNLMTAAWGN